MKSQFFVFLFLFWFRKTVRGYEYDFEDDNFEAGQYKHVVSSYDHHHHHGHGHGQGSVWSAFGPGQKLRLRRDAEEPAADDDDSEFVDALQIPKGYSNVHPPQKQGNVAEFNVLIFSVRDINELDMEISLEVRLQIFWKDTRLANWSLAIEPGKKYIVLHHKALRKIWLPDIYVENLKSVNQPVLMAKPASVRIYPDSVIRYSTRITLTMACKMNFYYYPTDTQTCPVEMKSYAYDDQTLKVQWTKKDSLTVLSAVDLPNFDFNLEENQTTVVLTRTKNLYSGIKIVVVLTRKLTYHLIQTYIPSALFVVVSWLSFLVPPESVPGRMAICMTTLLTLTSMFAAVRQNVPKVSYVKAIDIWMVTCVFFVFLTLLEYTIVLKLRSRIGGRPPFANLRARASSSVGLNLVGDSPTDPAGAAGGGGGGRRQTFSNWRQNSLAAPPRQNSLAAGPKVDVVVTPVGAGGATRASIAAPEEDGYLQAVKILEKYSWLVMIQLFLIFNLIYWPWLIIQSGYNEQHNATVYYPESG